MIGALRAATRVARVAKQTRQFSGKVNIEEEIKEMNKWKIITYVAIPVCIAKGAYDLSHPAHHDAEKPDYPFLHIRNKEFPWGPDGLFEVKHEH
ncbi:hypothetical protein ACKKBG_A11700 [Auxenochlorella protothecoides x Auxenochlorella symbiontica]|uniref:Cytochrome c oxidase subunit 6a, mitochondrial n=2 Tax=Auxenochlorella protothecoides TaxID=3075 RepID=A0A087SS09_AUXPR|nr:hypothetical protein F751_0787 [Auxenochlorella protothecoides]KFM28513.1 hypothetical protein F751_0787 [Auxenochlorella protothecoides]RMZ52058.1 hypothetical protein APUTEX25_001252 [Auxenochlorella protothecoides]|eukprot:RMZ52058.1 hypothetical protein APUTEX25_001252 [Auxenochlorella protothecoides]